MKYIVVLAIVVFLVRIDFFLRLIEKNMARFTPAPPEIETASNKEVIPLSQDQNLKQTPKEIFLALLGSFRVAPDASIRERAMVVFKDHPTMFSQKLDPELEAQVFRWRDLLHNNEPELVLFLLDLSKILQGENLEMLKRFFSLWMDIDMANFIAAYSKTKDTNCNIVTVFGDRIPEEEKLNEYYDREDALRALVADEKRAPLERALAKNCLLVLGLEISKVAPPPVPESSDEAAP